MEPSAEVRSVARAIREMFIGLTSEGFSEHQALVIVGQMISAQHQGREEE